MITSEDAFGNGLYDYFIGESVHEVIERDDGYIVVWNGPGAYFAEFDDWQPAEREAMNFAFGKVLDIGCGAGRHALYLQHTGLKAMGIDVSPLALEVCEQRGLVNTRECPITEVNSNLGKFDTIIMMGNNFGLLANPRRARWLLRRFYSMTSQNGRLIAASNDPYKTDDEDHLAYHTRNRQRGRMSGQIRIRVRYRGIKDKWFDYLMVSKAEMEDILIGTGWQVREYIDSGNAQYIAVIEKHT